MTQFIVYTRVSTKEQGDSRNGLEAQVRAVEDFVAREGGEIVASFEEVISGKFAFEDRPVMSQAMQMAAKTGATILVSKLDRLSRSMEHISKLMNNRKVRFTVASLGKQVDELQLHFYAMIAQNERKMIGERTKAALASKKARGEVLGIMTHTDPVESQKRAQAAAKAAMKDDADRFAENLRDDLELYRKAGLSMAQIAERFNKSGIKTARGGMWHSSTISYMMRRLDGTGNRIPRCDKKG